jgi:hypothetical protein
MRTRLRGTFDRGAAAGIVGATALAFWFLIVDGSRGDPFRTPAFIAGALLGLEPVSTTLWHLVLYTVIHYTVFILVGLAISVLLTKIYTAPSLFLGLALGFALFDVVLYTSFTVTGVDVVRELGWPVVLAGNLIAGMSLMGFLHMTGATPPVAWWAILGKNKMVREGVTSGFIGAGVIAVWFLIFDMARGQPFFTPGALGSALFLGSADLASVNVSAATVMGYSIVHIGAFVATGFVAAALAAYAEDTPPLILAAVLLFLCYEAFSIGLMSLVAEFLLDPVTWWAIAVGNAWATVAMGFYLWRRHPRLRQVLMENPFDQTN